MADTLYPASKAFAEGTIALDSIHTMHYEEFGNPKGIPIVYLHGGPGAGSGPDFHRFFDPEAFRIIVYDQRGCGKSTPAGEIRNNTPDLLVQDMETLRNHLGIDKWHVYGGSWGSTLSLLYAEEHPEQTLSLTLRGIFTMRQKEIDWSYGPNPPLAALRPEGAEKFLSFLTEEERAAPLRAYFNRLMSPDKDIAEKAARAMEAQDNFNASLNPPPAGEEDPESPLNGARIEAHFFLNCVFTPDDRILRNVDKIRHIPTHIVHGLYDLVCPPATAQDLKKAFPEATLEWVVSGHTATDPETTKALVHATDRIRDTGSPVLPPAPPANKTAAKPPGPKAS